MENETDQEVFKRIQSENGKKGGDTTKERYGLSHFSEIGKKAWENSPIKKKTK